MAEVYRHSGHKSAILSTLKQFHEQGRYWNVLVQVGAKRFKCQRSILAANSDYFDDMFSSDSSQGSNATAHQTITLPDDVDAAAFEILLRFMYTGEIRASDCNVHQLFVVSDFLRFRTYHFEERMTELVRYRCEELEPMSGTLDLLRYTCDKDENIFVDILSAHICRHLYHFSEDEQLMDIRFEHLNALLERSKKYIVPLPGSSDVLVKIVHNWVNHNREVRSQYRPKLMKKFDFANVSSDLIVTLMNKPENVVDDVLKVPSEGSFPELESLGAALEVFPLGITSRPRETILWNVPRISKLAIGVVTSSPPRMISNVLWKISLERISSDECYFSLCCEGTELASEWNVYAEATLTIKSFKDGEVEDFCEHLDRRLFSSSNSVYRSWDLPSFLPWNEFVDPENGYIAENGDSIVLEAEVSVGVPFLSYNPRSNINN